MIDKICRHIISYLMLLISIVLFIQVVARFVFSTGTFWTDELARFSLVWLVFLGAAVAIRDRSLINVDILENLFPSWTKFLKFFQVIASLIFCILLFKVGWETMGLVTAQRSPNMGVPMSVVYASIPIAMLIILFHLFTQFFRRKDKGGEAE